ncbi:hypothetical protein AAC387_Pa09g0970 [Persea americana]
MSNSSAHLLRENDILSLLPPLHGKSVLELGAGIGRFTGELAKDAGQVIAVDFIDSVIKKNESTNGHFKNVNFMCADVTSPNMQIQPESVDLIFSNWLQMYLSDKEVENLVERMMKWLKVDGFIFFRESCFHQSGDCKRRNNPTHYREPRFYTKAFKDCHAHDGFGTSFELSLISFKCITAYICWLWQKVKSINDRGFQLFLDNVQYKCSRILRYERVFGEGYVSTEGLGTTKEFVAKLELKPSQKVLDVGCAIGGGDFFMAENFDVEVADCTKKSYPDNAFDVIYSCDTILHIQDKPALFRTFYKWLKPGGKMLKDAGFKEVIAEERTDRFLNVLQRELDAIKKDKDAFIKEFSENDYSEIVNGWKAKLKRSSVGEQRWGLFIAKK